MSKKPLQGRIALVTGASRGLGRAIATALANSGAHVVALSRVTGALEELHDDITAKGGTCTLVNLDLAKLNEVDAIGPSLLKRWDHLDIFVANAGILGPLSPLPHVSAADWDKVMAINLTANFRLLRTLDPLLRRSDAGRVVFVSSGAATGKYAYWGPYAVSKAGIETLARTYANEVADTPIKVNIVNPGATATQMRAQAFPGEDQNTLNQPDQIAPLFVEVSKPSFKENGQSIDAKAWLADQGQSSGTPR